MMVAKMAPVFGSKRTHGRKAALNVDAFYSASSGGLIEGHLSTIATHDASMFASFLAVAFGEVISPPD